MKVVIEPPVNIEINNYITNKPYFIKDLADDSLYEQLIPKIVKVCNEPRIFNRLFAKKLIDGEKYHPINALEFLVYANKGWRNKDKFLFGIFDAKDNIVGAIELRSNTSESCEVGYWASENHPGIMSNTVIAISKLAKGAGYEMLFLLIAPDNTASLKVAKNAGFLLENPHFVNSKGSYQLFEKKL